MKITICGLADVYETPPDRLVNDKAVLKLLNGIVPRGEVDRLADYLEIELSKLGIVEGTIRLRFNDTEGLMLCTDYRCHRQLVEQELVELVRYTYAQWVDGAGESGFLFDSMGLILNVFATCRPEQIEATQIDDGVTTDPPSQIAILAYEGDLDGLALAIDSNNDINGSIQGYCGLHFAVLYGFVDSALLLIRRGADVNLLDPHKQSTLHLCALSNSLSDEKSSLIARALLVAGADRKKQTLSGETASDLALLRGKQKLLNVLDSVG